MSVSEGDVALMTRRLNPEGSGHRHRGHVGPGVLAHTDQHVVQRLMRAVQVGGRDLTDQLAIAS